VPRQAAYLAAHRVPGHRYLKPLGDQITRPAPSSVSGHTKGSWLGCGTRISN